MNQATTTLNLTAGLASEPGPATDPDGTAMPERIAEILGILGILASYGRHMLDTIEQRAVWSTFATIAQFFGTTALAAILPRIHRGIMRATALERVLRARARRGRDLVIPLPRISAPRAPKPPVAPTLAGLATAIGVEIIEHASAEATPAAKPARSRRRRAEDEPLTFDNLPSMEQLLAEVRRRPIGQTIVEILCDLGVSFTLCSGSFGTRIMHAIRWYNGSLGTYMNEMGQRQRKFADLRDRNQHLPAPANNRARVESAVGFFVGDPMVNPCDPAAASVAADRPASAPAAASAATANAPVAAAATGPP